MLVDPVVRQANCRFDFYSNDVESHCLKKYIDFMSRNFAVEACLEKKQGFMALIYFKLYAKKIVRVRR